MPISVGDAVLTFLGDTTQLDSAFDSVNATAQTKLAPAAAAAKGVGDGLKKAGEDGSKAGIQVSEAWIKVARATAESNAAQKQLADAMAAVKTAGGEEVVTLLALAQAQQRVAVASAELSVAQKEASAGIKEADFSMREATGTFAVGGELIGVSMPRHVRTFVASLPGVGAALSAAFSVVAVVAIIDVLAKVVEKIVEFHDAAEKLREEWTASDTEFLRASHSIEDQINAQKQKFIELTEGPIKGYEFALKHLRSTAEEELGRVSSLLDSEADKFKSRGGIMSFLFGGNDRHLVGEVSDSLHKFSADLQEVMNKAKEADSENPFAAYDAGIEAATKKIEELKEKEKEELEQRALGESHGFSNLDSGFSFLGLNADPASIQREITEVERARKLLQQGKENDAARDAANKKALADKELAYDKQINDARISGEQQVGLAILAVRAQEYQQLFSQGKESREKFIQQEKDLADQRYAIEVSAAQQRLALAQKDPIANAGQIKSEQAQIKELYFNHKLELLKIDADAYAKQTEQTERAMRVIVETTRTGTQARIDAENNLLAYIKSRSGEESDVYIEQQKRVEAARKAFVDEGNKIRDEERRGEDALLTSKTNSAIQYYQFVYQQAQISQERLKELTAKAQDDLYSRQRSHLLEQLSRLGLDETAKRVEVLNQIDALDQAHADILIRRGEDTATKLQQAYSQLGVKSVEVWEQEKVHAQEAFDTIQKGIHTVEELHAAQAKLLTIKIGLALQSGDFEAAKKYKKELDDISAAMERLGYSINKVNILSNKFFDNWHKQAPKTKDLAVQMSKTMKDAVDDLASANASAIQAWILGQESLGKAMRQATAQVLAEYAARAAVEAVYWLAYGFAMLAAWEFDRATNAFTAAAMLGGFAIVAGAAAYAINPRQDAQQSGGQIAGSPINEGGGSPGSSSGSSGDQNTNSVINVQRFARGALVSQPTLAIIGDSINSPSGAREAALPLDDPNAMEQVGAAIAAQLGGGGVSHHYHIEGLISADNLNKLVQKISRSIDKGNARLTSSNSHRVTKRS